MTARIFLAVALLTCLTQLGMAVLAGGSLERALERQATFGGRRQFETAANGVRAYFQALREEVVRLPARDGRRQELERAVAAWRQRQPAIDQVSVWQLSGRGDLKATFKAASGSTCDDAHVNLKTGTRDWLAGRIGVASDEPDIFLRPLGRRGFAPNRACLEVAIKNFVVLGLDAQGTEVWTVVRVGEEVLYPALAGIENGAAGLHDRDGRPLARPVEDVEYFLSHYIDARSLKRFFKDHKAKSEVMGTTFAGQHALALVGRLPELDDAVVCVTVLPDAVIGEMDQLYHDYALSGLLFTMLAVLLSFSLSRRFATPLEEITAMTRVIAGGAFDRRVDVNGVREIRGLAESVNHMAERISKLMTDQQEIGRINAELETARLVQETLFPSDDIHLAVFSLHATKLVATECGGDLWGLVRFPNGRYCVFISDASGHGVPAAFATVAARTAFALIEDLGRTDPNWDAARILGVLNHAIYATGGGRILMSMAVLVVDPAGGIVQFANAGHNFPVLVNAVDSAGASPEEVKLTPLRQPGNVLGEDLKTTWRQLTRQIRPGDRFFLYTDGIIEAPNRDGHRLGKKGLYDVIQGSFEKDAMNTKRRIEEKLGEFFGDATPADDCTLVILEVGAAEVDDVTKAS